VGAGNQNRGLAGGKGMLNAGKKVFSLLGKHVLIEQLELRSAFCGGFPRQALLLVQYLELRGEIPLREKISARHNIHVFFVLVVKGPILGDPQQPGQFAFRHLILRRFQALSIVLQLLLQTLNNRFFNRSWRLRQYLEVLVKERGFAAFVHRAFFKRSLSFILRRFHHVIPRRRGGPQIRHRRVLFPALFSPIHHPFFFLRQTLLVGIFLPLILLCFTVIKQFLPPLPDLARQLSLLPELLHVGLLVHVKNNPVPKPFPVHMPFPLFRRAPVILHAHRKRLPPVQRPDHLLRQSLRSLHHPPVRRVIHTPLVHRAHHITPSHQHPVFAQIAICFLPNRNMFSLNSTPPLLSLQTLSPLPKPPKNTFPQHNKNLLPQKNQKFTNP